MNPLGRLGLALSLGCVAVTIAGCAQRASVPGAGTPKAEAARPGVMAEAAQPQQTLPPGWERGPGGELIVPNAALMTHTGSMQVLFDRFDFVKSARVDDRGRIVGFTLRQIGQPPAQLGTFQVKDVLLDRVGNIVGMTPWERRDPPDCCTMTVTVTPTFTEYSCAGSCPPAQTCVEKFEVIEDDTRVWCECVDAT